MHRPESNDGQLRLPPRAQGNDPGVSAELYAARQSDADLLHRFAAGDQQALDVVYRRYLPHLLDYVRWQFPSLDTHRAEDAAEEAMLRAWRSHEKVGTADSFWAYLITIARNIVLQGLRARRPKEVDLPANIAAPGPSPAEALERRELAQQIPAALESLPKSQRQALELSWQGYSHKEIGARLSCTPNAARILVQKGNKKLGRRLSQCGDSCAIDDGQPEKCPARKENLYCPKYQSQRVL